MPSAGEEDSVTGTLKPVKGSVARSSIVSCCGGLAVMAQKANYLRPGFDPPSRHISCCP